LRVDAPDRLRAAALLPAGPGPLVLLHPGTGDHAEGRRWPARSFGQLAARLAARGPVRLAVTGTAGERDLVDTVKAHAQAPIGDLCGPLDPGLWSACLEAADLVVTNDTGPLHMADALGTATVALFGPNSPLRTGPRRSGSVALYADLPCSPCMDERTMKRTACHHFACMEALDVDAAAEACTRVLASSADREGAHASPR
jgi:ADP-heptose:LPS heptosyltransferase